ncbi:HDOD domain-containing protein [Pleionea litopenaei]|uniref:HDOD domain-containing protein n=1 Tax=Pleionea litopenaei TaxID=3070815 RepID=A0AA51X8J2_9GAMM|nr:HDOD domain-containing protein [Pleionea sp. HL-JVS1]WMS89036.1 HDOD domain-containing protein [Pleionea sp. HL-JVS1]
MPDDILKGVYIPPQPKLIDEIRMAGTDLDEIAQKISSDPGVSAAVMKTVNSPYFGLSARIASINQAVILLGIDRVVNIVKSMLLKSSMADISTSINMEQFWESSSAVAVVSSAVCRQLNLGLTDEAYTLGLFHNSGVPIIAQKVKNYGEIIKASYARPDGKITREEFKNIGMHHAAAGYRLTRVWKLPKLISEAVQNHHSVERLLDDSSIENPKLKSLVSVLKISEHMVRLYQRLGDAPKDYEWDIIKLSVLGFLGLSEYDEEDLEDAVSYTLGGIP